MKSLWKNEGKFKPSKNDGKLSEKEIQERIYGRYAKKKEELLKEVAESEEPEEKTPVKKTKGQLQKQPELEFMPPEKESSAKQLKEENESLRRELSLFKKQYLDLSKQKSVLSGKVVQLEAELEGIKKEHVMACIACSEDVKERTKRFLFIFWERLGAKKVLLIGAAVLILVAVIFGVGAVISSRKNLSPELYEQLTSDNNKKSKPGKTPVVNVAVTPARVTPGVSGKDTPYTIQVCVYQKKADAQKLMASLRTKGYDADMVAVPTINRESKLYRIYVGRFSKRDQAGPTLKKIRSEEGFKDSFLRKR